MARLVLALGDDWEGLYIDGVLLLQGHSLQPIAVLQQALKPAFKLTDDDIEQRYVNLTWLEDRGDLPSSLTEVVWE